MSDANYLAGYLPSGAVQPFSLMELSKTPQVNALAQPYQPSSVGDNIPYMLMDAYRGMGIPEAAIGPMTNKLSHVLAWTPPVAFADSASLIGNDLHHGNYKDAALKTAVLGGLGGVGYGLSRAFAPFIPTAGRRDMMQSAYRETLPGRSATPGGYVPVHPTNGNDLFETAAGRAEADALVTRMFSPGTFQAGNINNRSNMRSYLVPVE